MLEDLPSASISNIKGSIGRVASDKAKEQLKSKIPKIPVPSVKRDGKKSRARRRRGGRRRTRRMVR